MSDHRSRAQARLQDLILLLQSSSPCDSDQVRGLVEECEALSRSIAAFHMEAIRFRMFNVDRLLNRGALPWPPEASAIVADVRRELETAGFHTRSHQAPTQ